MGREKRSARAEQSRRERERKASTKTRNVCRPNAASENRNPTFFNFNLNEKEQWLFPSEDSQSFPPPRPPRLPVLSPEPACGMDQTELSGLDHTPTTPAHPT